MGRVSDASDVTANFQWSLNQIFLVRKEYFNQEGKKIEGIMCVSN